MKFMHDFRGVFMDPDDFELKMNGNFYYPAQSVIETWLKATRNANLMNGIDIRYQHSTIATPGCILCMHFCLILR